MQNHEALGSLVGDSVAADSQAIGVEDKREEAPKENHRASGVAEAEDVKREEGPKENHTALGATRVEDVKPEEGPKENHRALGATRVEDVKPEEGPKENHRASGVAGHEDPSVSFNTAEPPFKRCKLLGSSTLRVDNLVEEVPVKQRTEQEHESKPDPSKTLDSTVPSIRVAMDEEAEESEHEGFQEDEEIEPTEANSDGEQTSIASPTPPRSTRTVHYDPAEDSSSHAYLLKHHVMNCELACLSDLARTKLCRPVQSKSMRSP